MAATSSCPQAECLLAAGLQSRLLFPADADYASRIDSYWCNNAKLRPACIVQPQSTAEVATAVAALAAAGQKFAVRSGGHTNWAGSNNIADGVTIDLGLLRSVEYDAETQTVQIGPGSKWREVYAALEKQGRVVAGGREHEVGVGGLLLGGGNTFYTGRQGFACDNVVAYDVVLADGRVIVADARGEHAGLFCALKGGSNNFGIVTRFTMRTMPSGPVWGGVAAVPMDALPAAADAVVDFTANARSNPDCSLIFVVGHLPAFGGDVIVALNVDVSGTESAPAFKKLLALPELFNNYKITTLDEVLKYSALPPNYHNIWFTLTIKNDASIITKASELHTELVKKLEAQVPDGDFTSHCAFQPIPTLFAERSVAAGGNVLGLERNKHDGLLLQVSVSVRTPELAEFAQPQVRAVLEGVREFAQGIDGGVLPWLHLNYAHSSQEVLQSYGPENVRKIKEVAAKYDPSGVFQRLCPGGFKISAVKD